MNNPKRILIVEDDPDVREMIAAMLAQTDFEITSVDSIDTAMGELSNGQSFDLAVLDFWLGKNHSVGLMDSIKSKMRDVPIIVISGGNGSMDLEKTEAISDISGAVTFLQKPFRKADLIAAVKSAIE